MKKRRKEIKVSAYCEQPHPSREKVECELSFGHQLRPPDDEPLPIMEHRAVWKSKGRGHGKREWKYHWSDTMLSHIHRLAR